MHDAFCGGTTICNPPSREESQTCATTSDRQTSTAAHAVHGEWTINESCAGEAAGESGSSQPSKSACGQAIKSHVVFNLSAGASQQSKNMYSATNSDHELQR